MRRLLLEVFFATLIYTYFHHATACGENISYNPDIQHVYIVGQCDDRVSARLACDTLAGKHGYTPIVCSAYQETVVSTSAWLDEDVLTDTWPPFYLGIYYFDTELKDPDKNTGHHCPDPCFGDPVNGGTGNKIEERLVFLGPTIVWDRCEIFLRKSR
jgi:hypothetical protein